MSQKINWFFYNNPLDYLKTIDKMEETVRQKINNPNKADEVWALQHLPVYTTGTSFNKKDILVDTLKSPLVETKRGGKITFHGKGQLIVYPIIDLRSSKDLHLYLDKLQNIIKKTFNHFNVDAFINKKYPGIWVNHKHREYKIAFMGVRVKKWIAYHGVSINLNNDLSYFYDITPCGIENCEIISLREILNYNIDLPYFYDILKQYFYKEFIYYEK